jgi:arsenate reductase (glutaredoxin)
MTITIYHNPACGTSRNTLAMIRQSGEEPVVIEYLKDPPTRSRLVELIAAMGITPRELLRQKGTPYGELGLADTKWTDDELIDFMVAHPILINRPIVVTPKGARLCRPSEAVLNILPNPDIGAFTKEDGEVVFGGAAQPQSERTAMVTIQVFDPALCCSTGVCGVETDQALVNFSADVDWAKQNGAQIERFNLAQQPLVFAENATVKGFLERSGQEALPLILVDGDIALAGRYPSRAELARWAGVTEAEAKQGGCCGGTSCC